MEAFGPKQSLSADMIGKTKEIEKLAHRALLSWQGLATTRRKVRRGIN